MATFSTAPYTKMSFRQMLKAVKWCQNALNLRDWFVDLEVGDIFPKWGNEDDGSLASSKSNVPYFSAQIWVSASRCKNSNCHPVSVLCHEMIHVFLWSYGVCNHDERMVNTLEQHIFQTWLGEQKRNRKKK